MTKPENLLSQIAQKALEEFGKSPDWQLVVKFLRFEENCSKAESIFILSRHFNVSYDDALTLVHNSPHWVDRVKGDEQLNKEFWANAKSRAERSQD